MRVLILAAIASASFALSGCEAAEDRVFRIVYLEAQGGNAVYQDSLGDVYETGSLGRKQDYGNAAYWYRKSAEQGSGTGQTKLGRLYREGKGVEQDYGKAAYWYSKAAETAEAGGYRKQAVKERGFLEEVFRDALGAAERGHSHAQRALGWMYRHGVSVLQDYGEAAKWYRKAAEQGDAEGQLTLGKMYIGGEGVAQDYVLGYMWLNIAAASGSESEEARERRDELAGEMTPSQISEAQRLARECVDKGFKDC